MEAIIAMATRLGKAIAESPQAKALRDAQGALDAHAEVKQLLTDFRAQSEKVARLQAEQKPIEVDDKHRLAELETKLVGEDVFKKFTAAQFEYVDLMRKVNDELRKHLLET